MVHKLVLAAVLGLFCLGGAAAQTKDDKPSAAQKKIDAKLKKAVGLIKDKEFDEAKDLIDEVLELDPKRPDAWAYAAYLQSP